MCQLSRAQRRFHACHVRFPPAPPRLDGIPISKQIRCQGPAPPLSEDDCVGNACRHIDAALHFQPNQNNRRGLFDRTGICLFSGFPSPLLGLLIGLDAMTTVSWSVWTPQCLGNEPKCRERRQEFVNNSQYKTLCRTDEAGGGVMAYP